MARFSKFLTLLASVVANSALAHGDQVLSYPGTVCRLLNDAAVPLAQEAGLASELVYTRFGAIESRHPNRAIPIICPIVRGATNKSTGISVRVKFRTIVTSEQSQNSDEQLRCTLRNVESDGNSARQDVRNSQGTLNPNTNAPNSFSLAIDTSNVISDNGNDGGGYTLGCWLPPVRSQEGHTVRSAIIGYTVRERD